MKAAKKNQKNRQLSSCVDQRFDEHVTGCN